MSAPEGQPIGECPNCGGETHADAGECMFCNADLNKREIENKCTSCGELVKALLTDVCPSCKASFVGDMKECLCGRIIKKSEKMCVDCAGKLAESEGLKPDKEAVVEEIKKQTVDLRGTQYEQLQFPFPNQAYGTDGSRGFDLTTIDAYYVVERLNEIFGMCGQGWKLEIKEWINSGIEIVCIAELKYKVGNEWNAITCEGGKRIVKDRITDAYKSAHTNAICKGASFIGVGLNVYKGEFHGSEVSQKSTKQAPSRPTSEETSKPEVQGGLDAKLTFGKYKDALTWSEAAVQHPDYMEYLVENVPPHADMAKKAIDANIDEIIPIEARI